MVTNQKLQAGSVLMNVLGPQGVPEEPMGCKFVMVRSSRLVETHWGDVLDSGVERWPSASVYDSRKRDKGRSRYRIVIFQFLAEAFPARRWNLHGVRRREPNRTQRLNPEDKSLVCNFACKVPQTISTVLTVASLPDAITKHHVMRVVVYCETSSRTTTYSSKISYHAVIRTVINYNRYASQYHTRTGLKYVPVQCHCLT